MKQEVRKDKKGIVIKDPKQNIENVMRKRSYLKGSVWSRNKWAFRIVLLVLILLILTYVFYFLIY